MLALLVFGYGSLRDADRARLGALSGWVFALMIGLAIVMRLLMPMGWMYPLPDLGRFTLVWLAVEGLRWERRARWLNMPSGLWRYGWLLPATALLLMAFPSQGNGCLRGIPCSRCRAMRCWCIGCRAG
jgi:hypothetical protein